MGVVLRGIVPTNKMGVEEKCFSPFSHTWEDTDSRDWDLGEMS